MGNQISILKCCSYNQEKHVMKNDCKNKMSRKTGFYQKEILYNQDSDQPRLSATPITAIEKNQNLINFEQKSTAGTQCIKDIETNLRVFSKQESIYSNQNNLKSKRDISRSVKYSSCKKSKNSILSSISAEDKAIYEKIIETSQINFRVSLC